MIKQEKKQLIRICVILAVVAIIICIALNIKPKQQTGEAPIATEDIRQEEIIDTSDVEETEINWQDLTTITFDGWIGDTPIVNISYSEIPDLKKKIDGQYEEYKKVSVELNGMENQEWLSWLNRLTYTLEEQNYCSLPSDNEAYKDGENITITCQNDVLDKLNYKYEKTFETEVFNMKKEEEVITIIETEKEYIERTSETSSDEEPSQTYVKENLYRDVGPQVQIFIYNAKEANYDLTPDEDKELIYFVNSEDFTYVKQKAIENGNVSAIYLIDTSVYYEKSDNFKSIVGKWGGFTGGE